MTSWAIANILIDIHPGQFLLSGRVASVSLYVPLRSRYRGETFLSD